MAGFSSKLPSKILIILFIASLIWASFNLPVIFSARFLEIKNIIEKESSAVLSKNVRIGGIGFLPHGEIILKNIKIESAAKDISYAEIEKLNIRFNILELLKKAKEFHLEGAAVFKKPEFIGRIKYKSDIIITPYVISIGYLFLDFEKFRVDIKGNITDYTASPKAELNITSKEINIPGIGRINNLYSNLILSRDEAVVKNFNFFLNNFPLGLACRVSDFKSPLIEFNIMSYPGQLPSLRLFNPMNFELAFSGRKTGEAISGDLILTTQKLLSANPRKAYSATLKVDGLSCFLLNKAVSVNAEDISCETTVFGKKLYLNASDFKTSVYLSDKKACLAGLSVSVYKGLVKGNGFLDFSLKPAKLLLDFKVYKLDMEELITALGLNYELKGSLDFSGVFNNRLDPCLSGRLDIRDGYLKNAQVLGLISDFLNIPSLRSVYFENISSLAGFSLPNKEVMFDKIVLNDQGMDLRGNIRLKNTRKISGNLSVRLSTALLKESFKLRLLFFLIGERLEYQDFDFEIGGFVNSPQIKWLSTRFKENIMKYLSGGGRKSIEDTLEKAMDELTPRN